MARFHLRGHYDDPDTPETITRLEIREEGDDTTRVTTDPAEIRDILSMTGYYSAAGWNGGKTDGTS